MGHEGTDAINASKRDWTCFTCEPAPIDALKRCGEAIVEAVEFYATPFSTTNAKKRGLARGGSGDSGGGAGGGSGGAAAASATNGCTTVAKRQRGPRGGASRNVSTSKWTILQDVTLGREAVAIPVINEVDDDELPQFTYVSTSLEGDAGVHISRNLNFMCRCDCEGSDCLTNKNCACAKLNVNGVPRYDRKRRLVSMPAVVYECNYLCGCHAHKCKNRVVGLGLQLNLEVFKTGKCGWGVRCTTAIEAGTFVCEYAGELVSESTAESRGGRDQYVEEHLYKFSVAKYLH